MSGKRFTFSLSYNLRTNEKEEAFRHDVGWGSITRSSGRGTESVCADEQEKGELAFFETGNTMEKFAELLRNLSMTNEARSESYSTRGLSAQIETAQRHSMKLREKHPSCAGSPRAQDSGSTEIGRSKKTQ